MEELDNKLLSKDPTVIALIISKLEEHIKEEYVKGKKEVPEFDYLKIKCVSPDSKLNEVVAVSLLKLLENGVILPDDLLDEFCTFQCSKISSGIVKAISGILFYHLSKLEKSQFSSKFNLFQPQHPFITLLNRDFECLPYIYNEIKFSCGTSDEGYSWNVLNFPFYQYCLCNPTNKKPNFYKMKLWMNLIQTSRDTELITKLISWMLLNSTGSILISAELLNELSNFCWKKENNIEIQILLCLQVSVLYHLVSKNYDPRDTLESIELLMSKMPTVDCTNPILLILVRTITRCPSIHVLEILQICELLIRQPNVNFFVLESVKVSMLHWIGNPSELCSEIVAKAGEIFFFIQRSAKREEEPDVKFYMLYKKYEDLIISNQELYIASKLTVVCESWKNRDSILVFLKKLKNLGLNFIRRVIHLVFGLFVCDSKDVEITLSAFEIICVYIENLKKFSHLVLTLVLYKLSNTQDSKVHFELLKYLPKLAATNENYLKVVTTIKVLFSGADLALKTLGMRLMFDLWCINYKSYPYLEDMLTNVVEDSLPSKWEFYVNKAYIIKQICEIKPGIHGSDMVAHLSRILNVCSGENGEDLASSISLEAITVLCKEGVIDIETTWATLAPKYIGDKRPQVIKSLCGLVAAMPSLQEEVICKMWDHVVEIQNVQMKKAAFNALAAFGLENISPYFPNQYLDETPDPTNELKVLLVPGHYWIDFLKYQSDLSAAGDFLIELMGKEIDEYLKHIYYVASNKEPTHYTYLPSHSIVRGIAEYCRVQVQEWKVHKSVYVECMRILSQKYSKPLPPYNWCFLQELFHESELRTYCVNLASHQVMISGTARRFVENYIDALVTDFKNVDGALLIYSNLKYLANSIQPILLGPFLNNTLNYAKYMLKEENNKEFLATIVNNLKGVLLDTNIQEVNKKGIVAVIDEKLQTVETSDEMFDILMNCVLDYPDELLQNTTKLLNPEQMTTELFERAVKIRSALALRPNGTLKYLNDLIDLGTQNPDIVCVLKDFLHVFEQHNNYSERAEWTSDLLGRIEAAVRVITTKNLLFLIDVLIVALVTFSGFNSFLESNPEFQDYLMLLPQASALLMESKEFYNHTTKVTAKVIELMYHLNQDKSLPQVYQNVFGQTLQALRHHPDFKENNKWLKYLNCNVVLKNNL